MGKSLLDLANYVNELSKHIESEANRVAVQAAEFIVENLAVTTPVDTSKALSNWQVSLDYNDVSELSAYFPGYKGDTQFESADAAIEVAKDILSRKKPGETIYITNVVDYIEYLNLGHSPQAGAGFVDRIVDAGKMYIKTFKITRK